MSFTTVDLPRSRPLEWSPGWPLREDRLGWRYRPPVCPRPGTPTTPGCVARLTPRRDRRRVYPEAGPAPRTRSERAPGRSCLVTYVDRTMTCVDCGVEFIHSAADQEFYAAEGIHVRSQAVHVLPGLPAILPGGRRRRPVHGRSEGLRAHATTTARGSSSSRSARRAETRHRCRSSRAWTSPSTAPTASARSSPTELGHRTARRSRDPGQSRNASPLRKRSRWRPRHTVTRPAPWTCHAPLRPTTPVSSSIPRTTKPFGDCSATIADSGSGHAS